MSRRWSAFKLLTVAAFLLLLLAAFINRHPVKSEFEEAKEGLVMRKIAHEVLRYVGDSTSTLQPVERISPTAFQISFASGFSFSPDSLVRIIDNVIANNQLPDNYIVNVVENKSSKVVFGYAMLQSGQKNIVPCLGREQPLSEYRIVLRFPDESRVSANGLLLAGMGLLALGLLVPVVLRFTRPTPLAGLAETRPVAVSEKNSFPIGRFLFYPGERKLTIDKESIDLTTKEAKLLSIFAAQLNEVVERSRLQKEVWEDEGVIVGRSLDVFVSRLRKKLEADAGIQLVGVPNKGYRLEVAKA